MIHLGISPCPNDTYIFEQFCQRNEVQTHYADVQTLNDFAQESNTPFNVLKVSAGVIPRIDLNTWQILRCGGAMGYNCGPLLLGQASHKFDSSTVTWLPGKDTTANLLFLHWVQNTHVPVQYCAFDTLYKSLIQGKAKQGVVIHEHRFTWQRDGLELFADLGAYWEATTNSPIPLGLIIAKKSLGAQRILEIENQIIESLDHANERTDCITPYIQSHAQETDPSVMKAHIQLFVTPFSRDMGTAGHKALDTLFSIAHKSYK